MKDKESSFGRNLSKSLRKRNLTQTALAEMLGIDKTHVNKWVNNRVMPSSEYLDKISKALNYSIEELITGTFRDEIFYRQPKRIANEAEESAKEKVHTEELILIESYINGIIDSRDYIEKMNLKKKLLNIINAIL